MTAPDVRTGQVWFVQLDPTVGHEQRGDRPALVISSPEHLALWNGRVAVVVPLTSQQKPFRFRPEVAPNSWAICDQPRTVDTRRFRRRATELDPTPDTFADVCTIVAKMIHTP
ncbi:type II toxin-antitoxin system PemK/MazF family toxin [Prauserella aidingensis]|uniref:type II toxin-antitoxin system PemK/MazF family toxin n=1 Tax=Prauserella aidingensis TaxID=387890 RepID=UPI0027E30076|nr:type II toxin-antitoxin system PemK/MazF family toxin [Prauserella aidingensis]